MKKGTKLFWDVALAGVGAAIESAKKGIEDMAEEEQAAIRAGKTDDEDSDAKDVVSGEGT